MAVPTLRQLMDDTLTRMSMTSGIDTQIYTEERLRMAIQHKFDMLFDDYWWPQFLTQQEEYTLDGVTGQVVGDLTLKVKRFSDILHVFNEYSVEPLPRAPSNMRIREITNPCVQSVPDRTKVFRIIPIDSAGTIWISYRTRPEKFVTDEDEVDMDEQLIICGAAYDLLEDDATNPGAADKFKMYYDERLKQIEKNQFNFAQQSAPRELVPTRWR